MMKVLLNDERVNPSAKNNKALRTSTDIKVIEMLLKDNRVISSLFENEDIKYYQKTKDSNGVYRICKI